MRGRDVRGRLDQKMELALGSTSSPVGIARPARATQYSVGVGPECLWRKWQGGFGMAGYG